MNFKYFLMASVIFAVIISGCAQSDQSNLGTSKSNLESSDQQDKGQEGSGEKSGSTCCLPFCTTVGKEECEEAHGIWQMTSCDNLDECKQGCCKPVCEQTTKKFCEDSTGGPWLSGSCDQVKECKKSCCKPYCVEITELECGQRGGTSTGKSCSDDEDCKLGCCTPFCKEMTKSVCGKELGYGGVWHEEKCADLKECNEICCSVDKTFMTKEECYQQNGNEINNNLCAGKGTITVEMPHIVSCDCSGGAEGVTCTESMNLVQRFSVSLLPDPDVKDDGFLSQWINNEKNYHYEGTGTYTISGERTQEKTTSASVTCYGAGVPPNTKSIATRITSSDFTYSGTNTAEIKATVTVKNDGKYSISFEYPAMNGKEKEIWNDKSESGCPGVQPFTETKTYDQEFEGNIIQGGVENVATLKGSQTFKQFPPEQAFACEGSGNEGTGTITWDFDIPE